MSVSRKTILNKMEVEMTKAKSETENGESFLRHIANMKLLCELLLDESTEGSKSVPQSTTPTAEEVAWMMKGTRDVDQVDEVKHDPKSIFDF